MSTEKSYITKSGVDKSLSYSDLCEHEQDVDIKYCDYTEVLIL